MVSTTLVERPESISWAPLEAKPIVSITSTPGLRPYIPPDQNLPGVAIEEGH